MKDRLINPHRGLTFRCLDSSHVVQFEKPKEQIQPKVFEEGMPVEVKYGKLYFAGTITRNCGFNEYDVIYDETNQKEVGVKGERIRLLFPDVEEPYNFPDNSRKR